MADQHLLQGAVVGDWDAIEQSLKKGADINARFKNGGHHFHQAAIYVAINEEHWDVVFRLLEVPGIDLEAEHELWTPFLLVCKKGNLALVQKFHSLGVSNPHPRFSFAQSALHYACYLNNYELAEFVLNQCRCNPNWGETSGRGTPLHAACVHIEESTDALVTLLLDHGASLDTRNGFSATPLHIAARNEVLPSCDCSWAVGTHPL